MLSNHVYGLELIFGLLVCQIVFFLPLSLERSSPLPGYCDESTRSALASPLTSVLYFSIFVLGCVYLHCWRPPIKIKAQLPFFPSMQRVPMLLLLLWQQMFFFPLGSACIQSKWDLCRDSSGSTYCIQFIPSRQHSLFIQQAREKIPHHSLGWHQKLEFQGFWGGRWVNVVQRALRFTRKTRQQSLATANFSENYVEQNWKPQSLNIWQALHGSGTHLSLISWNGFRLGPFMSFLKTHGWAQCF